jgi:hypothetical protein
MSEDRFDLAVLHLREAMPGNCEILKSDLAWALRELDSLRRLVAVYNQDFATIAAISKKRA